MATDTPNDISYFVSVNQLYQAHLGHIRDWSHLKMGKEGTTIWLTGFKEEELQMLAIQTIPDKQCYYAKEGKLFKQGSLLPSRNLPSVLWTPIGRSLPVQLPDFNHNYFGIEAKINIQLKEVATVQKAAGMLVSVTDLGDYLTTASAVRLASLTWVMIGDTQAFIIGEPLLPINGEAYWQNRDSFLPLGYDFELPMLSTSIHQALNSNRTDWLLWNKQEEYTPISKAVFEPLRLGNFRETLP